MLILLFILLLFVGFVMLFLHKRLMPVHSSKFALAMHAWYEPLTEVTRLNSEYPVPLVAPMIGEGVNLQESGQTFQEWWKTLR